ncbi:hypothetical protein L602_002800000720 [Cupriavidus gilardii J11]|uniref:Uncharacterized protein n=1 Tax=Cupriavidus gilardii J11 TaxID=936133 RepID=A0A562BGS6_9BURK|nr:hypothetical protein L602_002800000720 [Cupriavidus gilardii J11]
MEAYVRQIITLILAASRPEPALAGDCNPAWALFESTQADTDGLLQHMQQLDMPCDPAQLGEDFAICVQRCVRALHPSDRERACHVFRQGGLVRAAHRAAAAEAPASGARAAMLGVCLDALQDCLMDAAVEPYRREPPVGMHGYAMALDRLLAALSACPADPDAHSLAELARLLDAAVTVGGAGRPGCNPGSYDELVRERLIEMEPESFRRLLALAAAPYDPAAPAQLPLRVVAQATAERRIAARELSKIFHHAKDLATHARSAGGLDRIPVADLSASHYAAERAGKALPVVDALLKGAQRIDVDGGAVFVNVRIRAGALKTPWFSPETAASFQAAMRTAAALICHGQGCQAALSPSLLEEWKETLRQELGGIRDIAGAVAQGQWPESASVPRRVDGRLRCFPVGPAEGAIAQRVAAIADKLGQLKAVLDQHARERLAAGPDTAIAILDQVRRSDPTARTDTARILERFIADTRTISDVALVTGLHDDAAALRQWADAVVAIIDDCGHLLTDGQLRDLRACTGLGIPMALLCDYTKAVKESLADCMKARETVRCLRSVRELANAVIALQHCVSLARAPAEAAPDSMAKGHFALRRIRLVVADFARDMSRESGARMLALVRRQEFRYCLSAARDAASDLRRYLDDVAAWCDKGVVADLELALKVAMQAPQVFADTLAGAPSAKGKARITTLPRRPSARTGAPAIRRLFETAWGVLVRDAESRCRIVGLNNAQFYALHGVIPKRAVVSDYRPEGYVFEQCEKMLLDRRTLTKGNVQMEFAGSITDSGQPESFVVNRQLWLDLHRSRYQIADIVLDRKRVALDREAAIRRRAHTEDELVSGSPYLYRVFAELRRMCTRAVGGRLHRRQMDWVSALLGQATAAAVSSLGTGRVIHYGWLGGGLLLKPSNTTVVEYICARADPRSEAVTIAMRQSDRPKAISVPRNRSGPGGGCRQLENRVSCARYELSVDIVGRRARMKPGSLSLRYAFVSEDIDSPVASW